MKSEWLHYTILGVASLLAPCDQREEWLAGWRSELWYIPRRGATAFCLGAFRDALWLRRNNLNVVKPTGINLESPLRCLAFLAILAALSSLIALYLPAPETMTRSRHVSVLGWLDGCIGMLLLCGLALPAILPAMGPHANRYPVPWPNRLRRGLFLALKLALMQPIMFCGFAMMCLSPITNVAFNIAWIVAIRWVLTDQRRRCPVCLHLLTDPVRIGSASRTFLEWYGAESTCSRGHGLLQISEISPSYSGRSQWLRLGDSWKGLFSQAAGARQP